MAFGVIEEGGFVRGTGIATSKGVVPVERLAAGDAVLTEAGPVALLGLESLGAARPAVIIRAGAFGPGRPAGDLALAAEHLIYFADPSGQGALARAGALVNGSTVLRPAEAAEADWFAPRLPAHALLLADGVPIGAARAPGAPLCAPAVPSGPALFALRGRVARGEISAVLPSTTPRGLLGADAPDLVLFADATAIAPPADGDWRFTIPARTGLVRLASPLRRLDSPDDERIFGVAIQALTLDGIPLDLAGPVAGRGFYPVEGTAPLIWRWTDGIAHLALPPCPRPRHLAVAITDWHRALLPAG